jgi:hypothetical protein
MAIPKEYLDSEFDFGFTTEDTQEIINTHVATAADYQAKLLQVEKLIIPLLVNLMKNPQVDTIKWPGRAPIIEKQIDKILAITRT